MAFSFGAPAAGAGAPATFSLAPLRECRPAFGAPAATPAPAGGGSFGAPATTAAALTGRRGRRWFSFGAPAGPRRRSALRPPPAAAPPAVYWRACGSAPGSRRRSALRPPRPRACRRVIWRTCGHAGGAPRRRPRRLSLRSGVRDARGLRRAAAPAPAAGGLFGAPAARCGAGARGGGGFPRRACRRTGARRCRRLFGAAGPPAAAAAPTLSFGDRHRAGRRALLRRRTGTRRDCTNASTAPPRHPKRPVPRRPLTSATSPSRRSSRPEGEAEADEGVHDADGAAARSENEIRRRAEIAGVRDAKNSGAQQRTEKVLDEVRAYQDDLDGDLDAMERHGTGLAAERRSAALHADVEREHAMI